MIKYFDEQGRGYSTISELCKLRNFSYQTFMRLKTNKKLSVEETAKLCSQYQPKHRRKRHTGIVIVNGVEYKDLGVACDKLLVNRSTVRRKQDLYGLSVNEALELICNTKKIDHLGNEFKSFKAMCTYHDIDYNVFLSRINKGYSIRECLTKRCIVDDNGNTYKSYSELCEANGFTKSRFFSALYRYDSDVIKTCMSLRSTLKSTYTYDGKSFSSLKKMCEAAGVDYYRVHYLRFKKKMDWQAAFDKVLDKMKQIEKREEDKNGK